MITANARDKIVPPWPLSSRAAAPAHRVRRSDYWPLVGVLAERAGETVTLTFAEVERALGQPLSLDAYERRNWWLAQPAGPRRTLQSAGWHVASVDVLSNLVTFARHSG